MPTITVWAVGGGGLHGGRSVPRCGWCGRTLAEAAEVVGLARGRLEPGSEASAATLRGWRAVRATLNMMAMRGASRVSRRREAVTWRRGCKGGSMRGGTVLAAAEAVAAVSADGLRILKSLGHRLGGGWCLRVVGGGGLRARRGVV